MNANNWDKDFVDSIKKINKENNKNQKEKSLKIHNEYSEKYGKKSLVKLNKDFKGFKKGLRGIVTEKKILSYNCFVFECSWGKNYKSERTMDNELNDCLIVTEKIK